MSASRRCPRGRTDGTAYLRTYSSPNPDRSQAGFARVKPEVETRDCQGPRLAAEDRAREQGLGLWVDPYYSIVRASDGDELRARDGLFAIVEGKVLKVGVG
jgi:hypothetical protein